MDVDSFIRANGGDWARLTSLTAKGHKGLARQGGETIEEAVTLHHRVSSHLAEAQTRLRDPDVIRHLTSLVATSRGAIYGVEARGGRDVAAIFGARYRQAVADVTPAVWVAAALLFGSLLLVELWTLLSSEARAGLAPGFAESLTGDRLRELRQSDPAIGLQIFVNNVRVAVMAFAFGATLGIGTVSVLIFNGIFIGALAGSAIATGHGTDFHNLVLPHGFLELFAICLSGGAGLHMGWSTIRPGDRPRSTALAEATKTGLIVVIGVIPAFALAAAIEGLLTGVTGLPLVEVAVGLAVALVYAWWLIAIGRDVRRAARRVEISPA